MSTNISSSTSYATVAQALLRKDARIWGDLVLDNNTRDPASQLPSDPVMLAVLLEASGMVEMACLRGERYTPTDLGTTLQGVSLAMLQGLVCELAFWLASTRRHPDRPLSPKTIWALQTLDALADGKAIFSLQEAADAGVQDEGYMSCDDWNTLNLATDQAKRHFGVRAKYRVPGGSAGCPGCGCDGE